MSGEAISAQPWTSTKVSYCAAAGTSEEEISDVLLAVIAVAGLGRVVSAAPGLAAALGYDLWAAWKTGLSLTAPGQVTAPAAPGRAGRGHGPG